MVVIVLVGVAEKYLRDTWPVITQALKEHGIKSELDLVSLVSWLITWRFEFGSHARTLVTPNWVGEVIFTISSTQL